MLNLLISGKHIEHEPVFFNLWCNEVSKFWFQLHHAFETKASYDIICRVFTKMVYLAIYPKLLLFLDILLLIYSQLNLVCNSLDCFSSLTPDFLLLLAVITSGSILCAASTGTDSNRSEKAGEAAWFIELMLPTTWRVTGVQSLISNLVPVSNQ